MYEISERVAHFALEAKLPSVSGWSSFVSKGLLVTYGPNVRALYRSLAGGEVLGLLGIWRGASFAMCDSATGLGLGSPAKEHPMATRLPASQHTREELTALIEGRLSTASAKDELVKLATRLIVEEALEGEASDAVGREYYEHGARPGQGYRNGYRTGRLRKAEELMEYAAPQIAGRDEPCPHPRCGAMALCQGHRVRTPADGCCQKRTR
jgi:Transposase, Mutator family